MTRKQHEEIVRSLKERNRELERENISLKAKIYGIRSVLTVAKSNLDLSLSAISEKTDNK